MISEEWFEFEEDVLRHMCKHVNFDKISDRIISDNEKIHKIIPWETIDRMKIVRLVARNIKIVDFVSLINYNYTISEIKEMLKIHPQIIELLSFDFKNINREDAFILLTIGNWKLFKMIDMEKYNFTPKEVYEIIESSEFNENVMRNIDLSDLKDYHISDIIIHTGVSFLDILDLKKLTARKWIEILQNRPEMVNYCDFEKFKESDIYNSVEIVCLFPNENLDFLITDRNYKEELSSFGWERLLISKPDEYDDKCCFWKFNETNWKNIISHHPDLAVHKL